MASTQDVTEALLQKARERRRNNKAAANLLEREKTGVETLTSPSIASSASVASGASIASGIRSPVLSRKTYNTTTPQTLGGSVTRGIAGGLAGGVKGVRPAPKRQAPKAVPLEEMEDDFECLQEQLQSRFKRKTPDFKENLLSPNNVLSAGTSGKISYFSDSQSPAKYKKQFFPEIKPTTVEPMKTAAGKDQVKEPVPPKRTTSKAGTAISKYNSLSSETSLSPSRALSPARTMSPIKTAQSPTQNILSPTKDILSPTKTTLPPTTNAQSPTRNILLPTKNAQSPNKCILSPTKNVLSATHSILSPSKSILTSTKTVQSPTKGSRSQIKKPFYSNNSNSPAKEAATYRPGSPIRNNPADKISPKRGASPTTGLRTMPSIRVKPNSLVSRALAKLQHNPEEVEIEDDKTPTQPETISEQQNVPSLTNTKHVTSPTRVTKSSMTPSTNTTVDDSMFIRNNMSTIQHDLDDIKMKVQSNQQEKIAPLPEEEEEEEEDEEEAEDEEEEEYQEPETKEDTISRPVEQITSSPRKVLQLGPDGDVDLDDSFDDLCNDILPSPPATGILSSVPAAGVLSSPTAVTSAVSSRALAPSSDSEWFEVSPDKGSDPNTSLKRDADSVYSSVESFISTPSSSSVAAAKSAFSPTRTPANPPFKKLRRSMSVSDIQHTPKSPSRFVRLDALRCSATSLDNRTRSSSYSLTTTCSTPVSRDARAGSVRKVNTYKGPLEQGTLELRPPFEQLKVLEQGVMVQNQLESQASQLLEHCTYGLEQVEAEKVLVIAGLKKELWKYHLNELKGDNHVFNTDNGGLPKGTLSIEGISLLLRQDYLVNQVVETKRNQAFFVAIKVSPYRLLTTNTATSEINLHGTKLNISDTIFIDNLPPNYKITLEVYCMSYNQLNNATPSKKKKTESTSSSKTNTPKRLLQSALSKMGANAQKKGSERTFSSTLESYRGSKTDLKQGSKFVLAGSLTLTIKDVKNTQFRLRRAPFHSPFEGTINLSMSAKESVSSEPPTHKGFLTIFQEESGLGAWNRRWCSVQDNKIYYWLYPEDQVNQNKEPHGEIDLRHCKTDKVTIASRLDCARPNTFVLVTQTSAMPGDRNSIITETDSKLTQTKYLLSADSRQERKEWMTVLNQCLLTIVSWNTNK